VEQQEDGMTTEPTIPSDTGTPAGRFPGFDTITEWVAWEHGWHVCDTCGQAGPAVRLDEEYVGGRGLVSFYRCTVPDPVCGWVYAACGAV
jgi:hypothetical protein